jgi:hypothetical protein
MPNGPNPVHIIIRLNEVDITCACLRIVFCILIQFEADIHDPANVPLNPSEPARIMVADELQGFDERCLEVGTLAADIGQNDALEPGNFAPSLGP